MKILIVKTSALGDIIHTFPVISYLRDRFPTCTIDWVVEKPFRELLEAHPDINEVHLVQTKKWRKTLFNPATLLAMRRFKRDLDSYDVLFDLQGNIKSGLITACAKARHKVGFDKESVPEWPNRLFTKRRFNPPPGQNIRYDYLSIVQQFFRDTRPFEPTPIQLCLEREERGLIHNVLANAFFEQPVVMICPGSAWPNKQIAESTLRDLCRELDERYLFVWGNEEEHLFAQKMHRAFPDSSLVAPKLSLSALQHLMTHMKLVIAMDSLPLHLCGTTSTPSFSVFGPSSSDKYKPLGDHHIALQGTCPYDQTFTKRCPRLRTCSTGLCIKAFNVEQLMKFLRKLPSYDKLKTEGRR